MSDRVTEEELAEVERLDGEATPGPWAAAGRRVWGQGRNDVAFIVRARTLLPRLAAEVRRLYLVHEQVAYALNISNDGNLPKAALELHTRQTEADMRLHIATCQRDAALEELAAANADRANLREALRQKARAVCDQAAANPAFLGFAAIDALRTELDKP